ncbi:hypothetical protein [Actinophytocola gossypii]|uniref:PH domain-containing protein n=1 Tax=Actinophytocola gossypii TaxID=2812003 RepID=A0ABT2JHZ7_9PSEU|nr:hypothetical protein [Actinophytocola gossypii]MCT2587510.1 hypothetical protein [Actinophytocola gossypii]
MAVYLLVGAALAGVGMLAPPPFGGTGLLGALSGTVLGWLLLIPFYARRGLTTGYHTVTNQRVIVRSPRLPVRRTERLADLADPVLLTDGATISFGDRSRYEPAGVRPDGAPVHPLVLRSVPDAERVLELIRDAQRDARAGG